MRILSASRREADESSAHGGGNDLPLGERTSDNLIGKHHIKIVLAVDTPNYMVARHADSGGDVNSLLGSTVSALYCHHDIACTGSGLLRGDSLRAADSTIEQESG